MIVVAHAGHWAVSLMYLFPFAVLVGVILVGRIRERRELADDAEPGADAPEDDAEGRYLARSDGESVERS